MTDAPRPDDAPSADPAALDSADDERSGGEAVLQRHLDALDRTAREAHAALHAAARDRAAEPLAQLVAETAAAHRQAMEEHGFDRPPDAPARPPAVLWDALTAYRRAMTDVLTHVRHAFRDLDLGATVGGLYDEILAALAAEAAAAPAEVVRPEPEGLIRAEAGDSLGLIGRKLTERTRRSTASVGRAVANAGRRLTRRTPHPRPVPLQTVPLRALLDEQATLRLPHAFVAEHRSLQTAIARAVAGLEDAFAEWTDGLLQLEPTLDRPRFHAPDAFAPPPPDATTLDEEYTAQVRRVRLLAQTLDDRLRAFTVALPAADPDLLDAARDVLAERVRRSGFDSDRAAQPGEGEPVAEITSAAQRWADWHRTVLRRMEVDGLLLGLREQLLDEVEALIETVTEGVIRPMHATVETAAEAFGVLRTEAAAACDRHDAPAPLAEALRALLERALEHVDRSMLPALQTLSLDRAVEEAIAAMRVRLDDALAVLPERVTLHARLGPDRVGQQGHAAEVELRRIVATTLSEEFAARLVKSTDGLRQPLFNAVSGAEGVRDVVVYNLETAIEELEAGAGAPADLPSASSPANADDEAEEAPLTSARELAVDGLARAEERLHQITDPLAEPWRAFVRRATETFEQGWTTLHERANAENLVQAHFLDFKTRARQTLLRTRDQAEELAQQIAVNTRKGLRVGRVGAQRLVEMGQAAAGLAAQTAADRQRTIDALAESDRIHAGLPLVYRRLFAFAPLTDPTLFENREAPLARVAELAERWRAGRDSSALVVTADPGGGLTSFANVLRATTFAADDVASLTLTERPADEATLTRLLSEALGIEGPDTFDALEARILAEPPRTVCVFEGLEQLVFRAPDGLDLVERTFIFMSRTDAQVLWVGTMTLPSWRFVERVAPQIAGLVASVPLDAFTRAQVEAALMRRHVRSGLPLVFAEPAEPSPLLARRLSRAPSPEARQEILRGEFFDGLFRASGPSLRLALLYWLRAADFEAAADTLTLRPVQPLDFTFLAAFDLPRSFALKALLLHGTLTLSEHDRIFRTTRDESFLIFESLHNLRLIQPATAAPRRNGTAGLPVREGVRYRLHPLAVAPVANALRGKNML